MAYTPRTLRRRKLLHRHNVIDPELVSLYHDEPVLNSSPSPTSASTTTNSVNANYAHQSSPIKMILGTPSQMTPRTRRLTDTNTKNDDFSNMYTPSSSLTERLNRINDVEANNNKQTTIDQDDNKSTDSIFDLHAYEMVPFKMKLALSAAEKECLFSRNNFFMEETPPPPPPPPQSSSPASSPLHFSSAAGENQAKSPAPSTPMAPASPASSVASVATSISETIDFSLLSWPSSPIASSPTSNNRFKPTSALSFGRVDPQQQQPHSPMTSQGAGNNSSGGAHPLATELVNPFLEPSSPLNTPTSPRREPSPPPVIKTTIPLSARMQQRFPNHTTMQIRKRQSRPHSSWTITDASSPQRQQTTTATTTTSRQRVVRLRQRPWVPPTRHSRRRIAIARKSVWVESSLSN